MIMLKLRSDTFWELLFHNVGARLSLMVSWLFIVSWIQVWVGLACIDRLFCSCYTAVEKCKVLEDAIFCVQYLALMVLGNQTALFCTAGRAIALRSYLFVKLFLPIHHQVGFTVIIVATTCCRLSSCIVADAWVGGLVCHWFTALFQRAIVTCLDFDCTFLMAVLLRLLLWRHALMAIWILRRFALFHENSLRSRGLWLNWRASVPPEAIAAA